MKDQSTSTANGGLNEPVNQRKITNEIAMHNARSVQSHRDSDVHHSSNKPALAADVSCTPATNSSTILESDLRAVKSCLMSQLNGDITHVDDSNIESGYEIVFNLLEKTVAQRERHSLLLVGPRSSGKSTIVNKALDNLKLVYPKEFLAIHLNASIHSDDSTAVREIARQLDLATKRQNANNGSTMSRTQQHLEAIVERKSIHETFANILNVLSVSLESKGDSQTKHMPLIFVIDEFEKFTSNIKQTLLYNLLDMSQNSEIPITVIGLTTKINARDFMEKRVNSRFSQRILTVLPTTQFPEFVRNSMSGFLLNPAFVESMNAPHYGETWNANSAVNALSDSELHLLVAAAKWTEKFNTPTINFNLAFVEYKSLMKESNAFAGAPFSLSNMKVDKKRLSKKALRNSWDVLFKCNLLVEPSSMSSATPSASTERRSIKTVMVGDNTMVLLEITLDELSLLIGDTRLAKRFLRL
ncbi:ORC4 [Candida theae]|uniref:Origin recognition complex subunit 4 n=1 Tax=Candida theae TaxID=1198502 RepID=A0AAD5G004_9ASCO|nr:ORC4 [Candida theae]KAI5963351.1 ORC4 [Candida theae]